MAASSVKTSATSYTTFRCGTRQMIRLDHRNIRNARPEPGNINSQLSPRLRQPHPVSFASSPSHHNQCRPSPLLNLPLLSARLHQPTLPSPPSTHLSQLTAQPPNRFPSQAPTSRDPFLAPRGRLRPRTKSKARAAAKSLQIVELAEERTRHNSLSLRHSRSR